MKKNIRVNIIEGKEDDYSDLPLYRLDQFHNKETAIKISVKKQFKSNKSLQNIMLNGEENLDLKK